MCASATFWLAIDHIRFLVQVTDHIVHVKTLRMSLTEQKLFCEGKLKVATMSMWLSNCRMMRPEIPPWLEDVCQKLSENDPKLTTVELTHHRIDDAQAHFLAKALAESTQVTVLILSCHSIVDDGALALASVIGSNRSIKKLQLRDLRNSREVTLFFKALGKNKTIEEFSLRHGQICMQSAVFLYDMLEFHQSLREIRFVDTQFIGGSFAHVCKGIQYNTSLCKMYLINAEIDVASGSEALCSMLSENSHLRELYLCENQLGDDGTTVLTEGLLDNTTLRKLDLRSNDIGVEGALSIATLVKTSPSLTGLHLGMNAIGNIGAGSLAQGLKFSSIQNLDLSDTEIDVEGARAIAKMLKSNTSIQELNLSFNSIGDEGATSIASVLDGNSTLHSLKMRRNGIGNKGAFAFAAKLPRMRGLKELVMIKNSIDQDGAAALLKGLRFNMELEYLHVEDKVSEPILREIVHWIRLNRAGRRIFRNTNLPANVWPAVLSNVNADIEVLYHFVCEKPDVFQDSKKRKMPAL